MKKRFLAALVTGLLVGWGGGVANATIYNFFVVEDNATAYDLSTQLLMDVTNGGSTIDFTFYNVGTIDSIISEIYFDSWDASSSTDTSVLNLATANWSDPTSWVSFDTQITPPDLSGGQTVVPEFVSDFGLDAVSVSLAIDDIPSLPTTTEFLTVSFDYFVSQDFDDIIAALNSGDLRIGLHVTSIESGDYSETYVNNPNPVPEPATMLLFGTGLAGLAGIARRRKKA